MRFWQYSIIDNFLGMRHQLICHKASRNRTSEGAFSPYFLSPTAAVGFFQRREEGGGEPLFPRLLFLPNYAHRLLSRASARVACQLAAQSAVLVFLAPLHLSIAVAEGHPERERALAGVLDGLSRSSFGRRRTDGDGAEAEATSHFSSPCEMPPWPRSIMRALYGARPGREATDGEGEKGVAVAL